MNDPLPLLIVAAVMLLTALAVFALFLSFFRLWLQALLAGTPVPIIDILAMRLRKVDARQVVESLILARQSGVSLSSVDLQRAYLQGADLKKLTLAWIEAQRRELPYAFDELVAADQRGQLAERLKA